jgi:predicted AlkP superfamily pyrophosphatase or phosphodiesterase
MVINQHSIETIKKQIISPSHVRPDYAGYNFANIPGTILNLFNVPVENRLQALALPGQASNEVSNKKVIFLFIDAFGWRKFEEFATESAVLQHFLQDGVVSQLTSQFPSTTTAHVTTAHTNLRVGQHGMYEWNYYEPRVDAMITPLFFSFTGDYTRGTLGGSGIEAQDIYPRHNIYAALSGQEVPSYIFNKGEYASSPYNTAVCHGATHQVSFDDLPQGLNRLAQAVLAQQGPGYFFLYWGQYDALCHTYGPDSPEADVELRSILELIETKLLGPLAEVRDTLLLVSADHGQTTIDPAQTIYLDRLLPDIGASFKRSGSGRPLVPAGSCRDFFLYIEEDRLDESKERLRRALDGRVQVLRVDGLLQDGYFGLPVSETFLARVGNLLLLPEPGESIWWAGPGGWELPFRGFHGGLHQEEMLIPLLALSL